VRIFNSICELIGNTPLLSANNFMNEVNSKARILLKLESFNPQGSAKDRPAKEMIEDAENKGILKKGSTIIEPTSGNTGIALAAIAAAKGYKCIIVMPDSMSIERRNLMAAYGAEVVLTDGKLGMSGAIEEAERLNKKLDNSIIIGQFTNPQNLVAHFKTTGPEIFRDTDGRHTGLSAQ